MKDKNEKQKIRKKKKTYIEKEKKKGVSWFGVRYDYRVCGTSRTHEQREGYIYIYIYAEIV